jgi:hypothetical protein
MALTSLTPLVVDTTGEIGAEKMCDHAFLMGSYNWRTGGFNFERCHLARGHTGPHEAQITIMLPRDRRILGRVQWTDEMDKPPSVDGDYWGVDSFWKRADKERAK